MGTKLTLSIEVDDEKIKGLLCCAFEGGSNYWAQVDDYELASGLYLDDFKKGGKLTDPKNYWHPCQIVPFVEGCAVIVMERENERRDRKTMHKLDRAAIQKGIDALMQKYPRHFGDFLSDNTDATTGDVFLQCCLFGEVVYG